MTSHTVHRLEYIQDVRNYRFNFMQEGFTKGPHIFVDCLEPDFKFDAYMKLFNFLPKDTNAVMIVAPYVTDVQVSMLEQFMPVFKYDQLLHETCIDTPLDTVWNNDADKFVCLTGQPAKYNRYRLIVELDKHGLLEKCIHSLVVLPEEYDTCLKLLDDDDREHYSDKFTILNNNPDKSIWYQSSSGSSWHGCDDCKQEIVSGNLFRLVTESAYTESVEFSPICITEKTYSAIAYRMPFIIAGQPGSLAHLKQMGFNTFDEYLISPYDDITDPKQRLDAVIENTKHWTEHLSQAPGVLDAIEHNHHRLQELMKQQETQLEQVFKKLGILYDFSKLALKPMLDNMANNDKKVDI